MKRIAIALLLTIIAASAVQAATIEEIQTGMYLENDILDVSGVVVVAIKTTSSNGFWISEGLGVNHGIFAYGPNADVAVGDVIDIVGGEYIEYYDLSELKTFDATVTVVGSAAPMANMLTVAEFNADLEGFEGCYVTLTDEMVVTGAPSEYGEWFATTVGGGEVMFDDYMFDPVAIMLDDCLNGVTGAVDYGYGNYKIQPIDGGVIVVECAVASEAVSFDAVKSLYR